MQFQLHPKIGARFKLIARKADESVARETQWFHNLVLDSGLARMSRSIWLDRCCVGTGNSVPVVAQTGLDAFVASTMTQRSSTGIIQTTNAPFYYSVTVTWRFDQGVAAGNLSEIGLGWSNTELWNRALIKDANNNPTTITVLSDEYLDVVSEIRVYLQDNVTGKFKLTDKTGVVISEHNYLIRPYYKTMGTFQSSEQVRTWDNGNIAALICSRYPIQDIVTRPPNYDYAGYGSYTYPTPTTMRNVVKFSLDQANFAHKTFVLFLKGMLNNESGFQVQIDPSITKTSSQEMTYTFEMSWGRYESS